MRLVLLLSLFMQQAWALTQEELNANMRLMDQQSQQIASRVANDDGDDCEDMFEPLPGRNGEVAFHTAVGAIENQVTNLQRYLSSECMNILVQNLATLPPEANARTVIQRLSDISRPIVVVDRSVQYACNPGTTDFADITALLQTVRNINECKPIPVGQGKRVRGRSPSNTRDVDYLLFQDKPNQYRAVLNVDFQQNGSTVTSAQMLARAKGCLAAAKNSLKGPDGKSLSVDLLSPSEIASTGVPAANRPAPQTVRITPGNVGSNAGNYQENIPCPILVHEVMHLLGLCDEYSGDRDGFACRSRGPLDSVMESAETAFARSVPRRVTCQCEDKDLCEALKASPGAREFMRFPRFEQVTNARFRNNYCSQKSMNRSTVREWLAQNNNSYPSNPTRASATEDGGVVFQELSLDDDGDIEGSTYTCSCAQGNVQECQRAAARLIQGPRETIGQDCPPFTKRTSLTWGRAPSASEATSNAISFDVPPVPGSSLLQASHFNRIIGGSCPTATPRYNACAAFAYETDPNKCADAPEYCQSASWLQEGTP